ncbi:flagellar motor protein MotD [Dyella sedimenti]|uniref:flagellar motor protein MotD n=1 Tax=Dyella sedimenti TaxID=2919947 RepID=UPI001FAABEA0
MKKASRKRREEPHISHESWAIPYADLMTLLLAFFVVMYAVSVVNEGKYRVMSESIIEAFNGSSHVIAPMPSTRVKPRNVDPAVAAPQRQPGAATTPIEVPIPQRPQPMRAVDVRAAQQHAEQQRNAERNLEMIRDQVQRALQPLIDKNMVIVRKTTSWLEIELRTDILFPSGVARLSEPASGVLDQMAGILKPFPNPVRIEGYTDDRPINTALYPSNWELSAARAASVARLFAEQGVDPTRLGIVGWSEYRPSADNATEDGRNHNRRVLIVVLSTEDAPKRFYNDVEHQGQFAGMDEAGQPAAAPPVAAGTLPQVPALSPLPVAAGKAVPPAPVRDGGTPSGAAATVTVTAPRQAPSERGP